MKNALFVVLSWSLLAGSCTLADTVTSLDIDDPPQGVFSDEWNSIYLNGQRVGYEHGIFLRERDYVRSLTEVRTTLGRGASQIQIRTRMETLERLEGTPLGFVLTNEMGQSPVKMTGQFKDGILSVQTEQGMRISNQEYSIDSEARLAWGLARIAMQQGFEKGTRYEALIYDPAITLTRALPAEFEVLGKDTIEMWGEAMEASLLRSMIHVDPQVFVADTWHDADGVTLKATIDMGAVRLQMQRTTRLAALAEPEVDDSFFNSLMIPTNERIPDSAREVTLKVRFTGDAQQLPDWPETYQQSLIATEGREAILRIRASDLANLPKAAATEADFSVYLQSSPYLDHNDRAVRNLAERAAGKARTPLETARKLHAFTVTEMEPSWDVGMATASEVARTLRGDCTEHALLLAALGRARGIPARVATGLIYVDSFMEQDRVFGAHAWTQFYLDGNWVDFDGALGPVETAPQRIAFATTAMEDGNASDFGLSMVSHLGQMEVEILEIR